MEHAIEHETLPLKEEKQLIRDIKQLRNVREQLSSNMGRQEEVQQALDQKSQVEEQSKVFISDIYFSVKISLHEASFDFLCETVEIKLETCCTQFPSIIKLCIYS